MTRAADPMTVAIREGVGARLLDLGFERKSQRAYVKETGAYSEWVHFRRHSEGDVTDTYGIFDNALQAFCDSVLEPPEDTATRYEPRPSHLYYEGRNHARHVIYDAVEAWRKARRPWRPFEYLIEHPETAHPYLQFISERGRWRDGGDPSGCARAMLECWTAYIEPERARLIADDKAVARRAVEVDSGHPDVRLATAVYAGEIECARAILARYVDPSAFAPDPDDVERRRRYERWSQSEAAEYAAEVTDASRAFADDMQKLARRLGVADC